MFLFHFNFAYLAQLRFLNLGLTKKSTHLDDENKNTMGCLARLKWDHMFWVHLLHGEHLKQENMKIGSPCYRTSRSIGATNARTT